MVSPSQSRQRFGIPRPAAARSRFFLLVLVGALSALLLGACAPQRQVLSEDAAAKRSAALLTGTAPAQPPPVADFAHVTALDLEASLGRLIVRPATWSKWVLGDPAPLLGPEEVTWARDVLAPLLPTLKPDQRVEFRFKDRFKHYNVRVEVYPEGPSLVYRFLELLADPEDMSPRPIMRPPTYAEVQVQPGQVYAFDNSAYFVRDRIFGRDGAEQQLAVKLAAVQRLVDDKRATAVQLEPVRRLLARQPQISLAALERYLEKLALVNQARDQGLFNPVEAGQRERSLLDELAGRPAGG